MPSDLPPKIHAFLLDQLRGSVRQAIRSGDWKVDGRNDPDFILHQIDKLMPVKKEKIAKKV